MKIQSKILFLPRYSLVLLHYFPCNVEILNSRLADLISPHLAQAKTWQEADGAQKDLEEVSKFWRPVLRKLILSVIEIPMAHLY